MEIIHMRNRSYLSQMFLIVLLVATSCGEKKEVVTKENLRDVLTRYGESHPENEVTIETSFGTIKLRLYDDTPLHRANFIKQINEDYYEDGTFYRIVNKFMIQGGVKTKPMLDYLIPAEIKPNHFHKRGALAMAHFDEGNPENNSSPTEFYIIQGQRYTEEDVTFEEQERKLKMTPEQKQTYMDVGGEFSLDGKYTVFGEVTEGFDVIDKIAAEKIMGGDKPIQKIPFTIKTNRKE
jgi:cyclophilin family peptidyl-prolyl cis-trans isomerase